MSTPELLKAFEAFLTESMEHELLLFIEALCELRHEEVDEAVDLGARRIFQTFILVGGSLELSIHEDARNHLTERLDSHRANWSIVRSADIDVIFKEIEARVTLELESKMSAFTYWLSNQANETPIRSAPLSAQKRVVVVGGGFTGFTVCSILDPMPRFHVTLIDPKDAFEYTPGMIRMLVRPHDSPQPRVHHCQYVKNGRVIRGYAKKIVNGSHIAVEDDLIPYDYLVLATGSSYVSKLRIKSTHSISTLYRMERLIGEHKELVKAEKVLIIGGGLVGCELASEIALTSFPQPFPKKKITLIEGHSCLVKRSNSKLQKRAIEYLRNLGVNVVLNERIVDTELGKYRYHSARGTIYEGFAKVFVATGTNPESSILLGDGDEGFEGCVDPWKRIKVKSTLQLDHWKYTNIFAGGDATNTIEEKTGYAATLAGVAIARNITRIEKGKKPLSQGKGGSLKVVKPFQGPAATGGIGKAKLPFIKRKFAFLNRDWSALKSFDEQQFLKIVQGEAYMSSLAFGRAPKKLGLVSDNPLSSPTTPVNNIAFNRSSVKDLLFYKDARGVEEVFDDQAYVTSESVSSTSDLSVASTESPPG